jgi:hypothetical protein
VGIGRFSENRLQNFFNPAGFTFLMAFSKSFPKQDGKSNYPKWEEVFLTDKEEKDIEALSRKENIRLMEECLDDAEKIAERNLNNGFETSIVSIAITLFEKRASHTVFWKEQKAKDMFDAANAGN